MHAVAFSLHSTVENGIVLCYLADLLSCVRNNSERFYVLLILCMSVLLMILELIDGPHFCLDYLVL